MNEFLNKRFSTYKNRMQFHSAIITHPDKDHYLGFESIFNNHNIGFDVVYQNGLVEKPVSGTFEKIGGFTEDENGDSYLNEISEDKAHIEQHFFDDSLFGRFEFPPVMHAALNNPNIQDFKMLSTHHSVSENGRNWMPQFAPSDNRGYQIEVLGPVVEFDKNGEPRLRRISSAYGKTKNGHSILLRLHFKEFKVFFGGDLNKVAERFLLSQYTQDKFYKKSHKLYSTMRAKAREYFAADIMKVCHHGASDVTDEFLDTVGAAAFVISSGDEEGHVHPRPDLLGRLGKLGWSDAPVILSTELQRSTREKADAKLVKSISGDISDYAANFNNNDDSDKSKFSKIIEDLKVLGRSDVQVNGTIYLKTDGETLLTSFKKESDTEKWFSFKYVRKKDGRLSAIS